MNEHERTTAYLDGELPEAEHAAAIEHLATCAQCQADAETFVALDAAMSRAPAAPVIARPRRWPWIAAAGAALAAAAVIAIVVVRPSAPRPAPAIALAETRPVEARFTSAPFSAHRPYRVARGDADRELVSLEALARLEREGDRAGLAAAHLLAGDPVRARAAIDPLPASPAKDAMLAAIALAEHDPAAALVAADRALAAEPALDAARWNRALALRDLDLPLAAAAELDAVAAHGEPGWADEAKSRAEALRGPVLAGRDDFAAFTAAARAMIAGEGPPLDAAAVARHPGLTRIHFHDALRAADDARTLIPLADALDRASGTDTARRAIDRVLAKDAATRKRFQARYRAFVAGARDDAAALLEDLRRAGPAVDDLWLGVAVLAGKLTAERERAAAIIDADHDPWFTLVLAREDAAAALAAGDPFAAEQRLAEAAATCDAAWSLRCGAIEEDLAQVELRLARHDEAAAHAARALAAYTAAGAPPHQDRMLARLADIEWLRGRSALALAYLAEYRLRAPGCGEQLFADELAALVRLADGDVASARALLPPAGRCDAAPNPARLVSAVAIARVGDDADRERANALIAAARAATPALADLAAGRLAIDHDPAAAAQVRAGMAAIARDVPDERDAAELRTWGWATLIGDAGRRSDWPGALALFEEELNHAAPAGCLVAASSDDERSVALVRGPDGTVRGAYQTDRRIGAVDAATIVPKDLLTPLARCPSIAVIARPPLHGATTLLPPELPWAFVGPTRASQPATGAHAVIVDDARPPASLNLPALRPATAPPNALRVTGSSATPSRVRAALADATYVELHAHGIVDAAQSETSFLALSPDPSGDYALTAATVRATPMRGAPVVVLAACRTATVAPSLHRRWSLPDAFLAAGARAVIATTDAVPDDEVGPWLADLRARLDRGETPAAAVAALRARALADGKAWAAGWLVFE